MPDPPFDPKQLHEDIRLFQKLLLIMAYDQQEGRPAEHGALEGNRAGDLARALRHGRQNVRDSG